MTTVGATGSRLRSRHLATDEPGDTSPFAIGLVLRRAHKRAADALLGALRPLGLELRHFAVLMALNAYGTISQHRLVDITGSDKASMVRTIDDLERNGLVARRPFPGDRRVRAIELTPRGLVIFDDAHEKAAVIVDHLVAHLDHGEARQLRILLTRFAYPDS